MNAATIALAERLGVALLHSLWQGAIVGCILLGMLPALKGAKTQVRYLVCWAALMLLEGISADEALARARANHPSCRPDPYNWFLLQRLHDAVAAEKLAGEDTQSLPAVNAASLLQSEAPVG